MAHDHAITPAHAHIEGEDDDTIGAGVDGITKVAIASAFAIPVFAEVAIGGITAKDVVSFARRFADRGDESISQRHADFALGMQREPACGPEQDAEEDEKSSGSLHELDTLPGLRPGANGLGLAIF
jgi:hypothetical protein